MYGVVVARDEIHCAVQNQFSDGQSIFFGQIVYTASGSSTDTMRASRSRSDAAGNLTTGSGGIEPSLKGIAQLRKTIAKFFGARACL